MNLDEWKKYKAIQECVQKGKSVFIGMIPMEEFLSKEICYSRMRGKELIDLKAKVRKLLSGLGFPPLKCKVNKEGGFITGTF
jgi:hypothetical protein